VFGAATSPDVVVVVLGTEVLVELLGFVVVVVDRTVVDVLVDVVDVEPEVAVQHEELALAGDCQWFASPVPPVVSYMYEAFTAIDVALPRHVTGKLIPYVFSDVLNVGVTFPVPQLQVELYTFDCVSIMAPANGPL
jgi:hypothetical protein